MLFIDFTEGLNDKLFEFVDDKNLKGKVWVIFQDVSNPKEYKI